MNGNEQRSMDLSSPISHIDKIGIEGEGVAANTFSHSPVEM